MSFATTVTAITIVARTARPLVGTAFAALAISVTRRTTALIAITTPVATLTALLFLRRTCWGGLAPSLCRRSGRSWRARPIWLAIAAIATLIASAIPATFTTMAAMALALPLRSAVDSPLFTPMAAARAPDLDEDLFGRRGCCLGSGLRR
jgi:hypothetical protein